MAVSVEAYWLVNFAMDLLATAIIARSLGRVRWKRVALAAAVGASWAALAQLGALRFLGSLPALAALSLLMAAIAIPPDSLRTALVSGAALLGGGVFLGGVQLAALRLFRGAGAAAFFAGALLGAGALLAATALRKKRLVTWEVQVFLSAGGGEARFRALVDTGNRLREPFSGLPVLICERGVLADVLPAGYDALPPGGAPPGFRQVGYGALGGGGRMNCFRPELCLVDYGNGYLKSPDLWVAVYPGKMPGGVRALAPPVVGAAQPPSRRAAARTTG
ncbi:MAG TPA: sigma-E processing peptidase SpoIIGA [Candidatus Pullichristensenella stercoripullorum]|nr:sigma-E processing peptidase SpoIIGA [Candidatus Pullichristensenella stercoripullorum]